MPETWTAEKDQRLLAIAAEAGTTDSTITHRAIGQHLDKLKLKFGTGNKSNKSATPRKPATPRKAADAGAVPKTPNSNKRRRTSSMSEEEEEEEESESESGIMRGLPARERSTRRSKTPRRSYTDPGSDDEGEHGAKVEDGGHEVDAMSEVSDFETSLVFK